MLPFEPEPGFLLTKRYKDAVQRIYLLKEMDGPNRPSINRKHVFDFQDGLRLIVSRERCDDGEVILHWSASIHEDHLTRPKFKGPEFMQFVMEHMAELWEEVGCTKGQVMAVSTEKGVFHFFLLEGQKDPELPEGLEGPEGWEMGDPRLN